MSSLRINVGLVDQIIENALNEDIGAGDVTTETLCAETDTCNATINAKQDGIIAGLPVAGMVFRKLSPGIKWTEKVVEGGRVKPDQIIAEISGSARAIFTGERLALNVLQRMSGIATATSQYVKAVEGLNVKILDTRKTAPGLRILDKYAVAVGGGFNHRFGLYDAVLIKDNHLMFAGSVTQAVSRVRAKYMDKLKIEVEAATLDQVKEALNAKADIIMLDNMTTMQMTEAVGIIGNKAMVEASGGVTLQTVRSIGETGVDFISVGSVTHSSPALDISLYMV